MPMEDAIQDALDDLASNKSSTARQGRALDKLERLLAEICVTAEADCTDALQSFITLQDTFQCNVPFRLLSWISNSLLVLSALTSRSATTNHDFELATLSSQIAQALSLMQGIALIHSGSKSYLGRRYPLQVLVELFYTARRVPPISTSVSTNLSAPSPTSSVNKSSKGVTSMPLANIVLDTLLCILVDAPSALRVFEDVNGVHTLVKMFKRAATPREVRMRCIEFLYFYLMDESPVGLATENHQAHSHSSSISSTSSDQYIPTAPSSPVHSSCQRRSALSISQRSDSSVSSMDSCSTTSSAGSASTRATSVCSVRSSTSTSSTLPPVSPLAPSPNIVERSRQARSGSAQPRSLSILRSESELRPLSPKNAQSKLGVGNPRQSSSRLLQRIENTVLSSDRAEQGECVNSTSSLIAHLDELQTPRQVVQRTQATSLRQIDTPSTPIASSQRGHRRAQSSIEIGSPGSPVTRSPTASVSGSKEGGKNLLPVKSGVRSMQEKKAFLGTMLGNVDALVESIQNAGILGLV